MLYNFFHSECEKIGKLDHNLKMVVNYEIKQKGLEKLRKIRFLCLNLGCAIFILSSK